MTERQNDPEVCLRAPGPRDGARIWQLVADCPPLDRNSMYFNLIQCDHFAQTCILAEQGDKLLGWVSGHVPPSRPGTLFVWQVAVDAEARGMGLGRQMLAQLVERTGARRIETTITKDNDASWGLFRGFAGAREAELRSTPHFTRDVHFDGAHATEHLVRIELDAARKAA